MTELVLDAPGDELLKLKIIPKELGDSRHFITLIGRDEELDKCLPGKHVVDVVHSLKVVIANRSLALATGPRG